jgi:hypothetical protein
MTDTFLALTLERPDLLCDGNYINGSWQPGQDGARYDVADPASGATFAQVPTVQRPRSRPGAPCPHATAPPSSNAGMH